MRDPNRIKPILRRLETLWRLCPDMRLGQLIHFISASVDRPGDFFYVEDDKWLKAIDKTIKKNT